MGHGFKENIPENRFIAKINYSFFLKKKIPFVNVLFFLSLITPTFENKGVITMKGDGQKY